MDKYRIKYKEIKPGVYRSILQFVSSKGITKDVPYEVELDFNVMEYYIINMNQQKVVKSNQNEKMKINNKAVLKRKAKKALRQLGVDFGYEIRLK